MLARHHKMIRRRTAEQPLSAPQREALLLLLADRKFIYHPSRAFWCSENNHHVSHAVIESLYERYLVKIVVDGWRRGSHYTELTDIGEHIACEVLHRRASGQDYNASRITEQAQKFIVGLTS